MVVGVKALRGWECKNHSSHLANNLEHLPCTVSLRAGGQSISKARCQRQFDAKWEKTGDGNGLGTRLTHTPTPLQPHTSPHTHPQPTHQITYLPPKVAIVHVYEFSCSICRRCCGIAHEILHKVQGPINVVIAGIEYDVSFCVFFSRLTSDFAWAIPYSLFVARLCNSLSCAGIQVGIQNCCFTGAC